MPELDDHQLLAEFARSQSETAFATLVERYVNLVYSTALRFAGNPHHAEEITQAVFIILARKAAKLSSRTVLSGWLYQTARLTAANFMKGEIRRQRREQEAYMQSTLNEPESAAWEQLEPMLDEAMGRLGETDRNAVVMRYFQNKTAAEVASALRTTEAAAHKRLNRALEKLREIFTKRGVMLSAAIIGGALAANSVQAAPVGLAGTVVASAASGSTLAASMAALVKGTLKTMMWLKLKFAGGVGAVILLAGGAVTLATSGSNPGAPAPTSPVGGSPGISVFSMLEKVPIISNVTFDREIYSSSIPTEARKQTYSFKFDGNNFLCSTRGTDVGKYDELWWNAQAGSLTFYDPEINRSGEGSGGILELAEIVKMIGNELLDFGIPNMKPGTAEWSADHHHFSAEATDGSKLSVDITLKNEMPVLAEVRSADGRLRESVEYSYSPTFFDAKVPVAFSTYRGGSKSPEAKLTTIQIRALEISDSHLPRQAIDPNQVYVGISKLFYSNNIAYWIGPRGKVSHVLTMEEYKAQLEKLKVRAPKR